MTSILKINGLRAMETGKGPRSNQCENEICGEKRRQMANKLVVGVKNQKGRRNKKLGGSEKSKA